MASVFSASIQTTSRVVPAHPGNGDLRGCKSAERAASGSSARLLHRHKGRLDRGWLHKGSPRGSYWLPRRRSHRLQSRGWLSGGCSVAVAWAGLPDAARKGSAEATSAQGRRALTLRAAEGHVDSSGSGPVRPRFHRRRCRRPPWCSACSCKEAQARGMKYIVSFSLALAAPEHGLRGFLDVGQRLEFSGRVTPGANWRARRPLRRWCCRARLTSTCS
jgi:hypothetical protein